MPDSEGGREKLNSMRRGAAIVAVSVMALALSTVPAFAAGIPYGGGTGAGGGAGGLPGLPGSVVTTCTFEGPPLTCTAMIGAYTISVFMPADSLADGSQLEITSVNAAQAGSGVLLLAFGVGVFLNGSKVTTTFAQPLSVTVTGPGITSSTVVNQETANGTVVVPVMATKGTLVFAMPADPSYQLVNPVTAAATSVIGGATVPVTGKPFRGEEILAGILVGFGALLLVGLRLRRRRVTTSVVRSD
jgi:hypothetical protein